MRTIYTLGYEGTTLSSFIFTLKEKNVTLLLDIREIAQSRRPGFSKKSLSEALEQVGISYQHIRQLGDPKPGREAARRGRMDEFRSIFNHHLELSISQIALRKIAEESTTETIVLMCYEREPHNCHRSIVADRLMNSNCIEVIHLYT